jgi:chromosome partitioning protein
MRTIAFVTQKGGAGKSTLASNLAVAAMLAGERVFIIDLDCTQSIATWHKVRGRADIGVEHVPVAKLAKTIEALERKGVTLAIIDAPGSQGEELDATFAAADLCIIPARPNAFDLWASALTRGKVKASGKDYAFLLNQCPPAQQSQRVEQGAKTLEAMGALLTPLISARVDYQEAARHGLAVAELHPNGVAAQEIRDLWASVKRRLKRIAVAPAKAEAKSETKLAAKAEQKAPAKGAAKPAAPIAKAEPAKNASAAHKPARKAA